MKDIIQTLIEINNKLSQVEGAYSKDEIVVRKINDVQQSIVLLAKELTKTGTQNVEELKRE